MFPQDNIEYSKELNIKDSEFRIIKTILENDDCFLILLHDKTHIKLNKRKGERNASNK